VGLLFFGGKKQEGQWMMDAVEGKCLFCNSNREHDQTQDVATDHVFKYHCVRCGHVYFKISLFDFLTLSLNPKDKKVVCINTRNEYEIRGREDFARPLTIANLLQSIEQYRPLDPLDKMDNALLNLERQSRHIGHVLKINIQGDYPYYHCFEPIELHGLLVLLCKEGYIEARDPQNPHNELSLDTKGYQRLREIKKTSDSRQCFVAMWFTPEMHGVYLNAIKPAIEYVEEGEDEPKFRAVKIDGVEHINDINDEIIATLPDSFDNAL